MNDSYYVLQQNLSPPSYSWKAGAGPDKKYGRLAKIVKNSGWVVKHPEIISWNDSALYTTK